MASQRWRARELENGLCGSGRRSGRRSFWLLSSGQWRVVGVVHPGCVGVVGVVELEGGKVGSRRWDRRGKSNPNPKVNKFKLLRIPS